MLGHLGLNVDDLAATKAYYDRFMPLLGFETFLDRAEELAYRPAGGKPGTFLFFYVAESVGGYDRRHGGLQHMAFMVRPRRLVDEAHALASRLGSTVLHPPREFPEYPPPYYATFWLDPNGFVLEAVCHHHDPAV